jgi:hypothetical protein
MEKVTGDKSKTIKETYEPAGHRLALGMERKELVNKLRHKLAAGQESARQELQRRREK